MDGDASFGRWLQRRRKTLDLTQEQLGQCAGCTAATIRKIEADERRPSREVAKLLAACLQIPEVDRDAFVRFARGERAAHDLTPVEQPVSIPAETPEPAGHNLPAQATALIGRQQDIAAVCAMLRRPNVRLVTLTGPGGIGKTRLAIQVAGELVANFRDGVCFVNLAPIADPSLVLPTIAQALGLKESGSHPLTDMLVAFLRGRNLLLVLDNFEQLVAAAPVLAQLLAAAPQLSFLVTSRAVLHLYGEHEYPVPPLALPDLGCPVPDHSLTQYAAVVLFIQRALAAKPDFALTSTNGPAVAGICAHLDGLPLAIELAAARIKLFTPESLLARLGQRFDILRGGPRDAPARHQTLRAAIGWSYDLLTAAEQRLFHRLAVFVGGWTLDAAEAVCYGDDEDGSDPRDELLSLLDHSLIWQPASPSDERRFTMYETIGEYARERLELNREAEATRRKHAEFHLALAERAEPDLWTDQQLVWLSRLEAEHNNLRVALQWFLAVSDTDKLLRLSAAIWRFWLLHGHVAEGRNWLERALALSRDTVSTTRAQALVGAGWMAWHRGDYATAARLNEEALIIAEKLGDKYWIATALHHIGIQAYEQGDFQAARRQYTASLALAREIGAELLVARSLASLGIVAEYLGEYAQSRAHHAESLTLWRRIGDRWGITLALGGLGWIAFSEGDFATARARFLECLALRRELGDRQRLAQSYNALGRLSLAEGDVDAARTLVEQGLAISRELDDTWGIANALQDLGTAALDASDYMSAGHYFAASLGLHQRMGNKRGIVPCLEGLASSAGARSSKERRPDRAARLFGVARRLREASGHRLHPPDQPRYDRYVAETLAQLGAESFTALWEEGQALTLEQAIGYALEETDFRADLVHALAEDGRVAERQSKGD